MSANFEKVKAVFQEAVEKVSPKQWDSFLDSACGGDGELRQSVERLLRAHAEGGSALDDPAVPNYVTTLSSSCAERSGAEIGPYKLLQQVGEGGMGTVWMAEQREPVRRKVALKIIKPGMDSRQVIARFEAERQALALMDHPNIAKVFDAGTTSAGHPYFVMELVKGVPITKWCDEHRLPPRERLELFVPVCQAIQHAHQKGIIHRDIKPSNVLVAPYDGQPVVKVIDFGVAKATGQRLTERTLFTEFGAVIGTLEYMSPEQAELNNQDIDTRSDIYSLGVLLYELLTGTTPLNRETLKQAAFHEILRMIREQEPPKPSTRLSESKDSLPSISAQRQMEPAKLRKLVRGELDWIVMKSLEKDRSRRYETANGFALDLQRYLADEPVQAGPPSAWYRFRKFTRRNKGPVLAAVSIVLLLLVGILGLSLSLAAVERERKQTAKERDEKSKALAAETKARDAERQAREQAIAALEALSDDVVENQLARDDHLTAENKEFLGKIIKHYEDFAALTGDDAESRDIRAVGYERVGRMRARLGELQEAEAAYRDALAIRKELVNEFPSRLKFRWRLASVLNNLAMLFDGIGRQKEAEAACRDALAAYSQSDTDFQATSLEFRQTKAAVQHNLGLLLSGTGRLMEAEVAYREALAIRKQLAGEFPTRPEVRMELAASHNSLGNLLKNTGRWKEAETAYRDAVAIQKQLVADFPTRPEFRRRLAASHNSLGYWLRASGRWKEAETAYGEALAIQKQLVADFPSRPEFRWQLALTHNSLGYLLGLTGRLKEAETAYDAALAIQRQLTADFPTRVDFRATLAECHNGRGKVLRVTGRLKEAETAYRDALAIRKQLAADFPNESPTRNVLADTLVDLAILFNLRRDFAAAKAYLEEAHAHHQAALNANPSDLYYQGCYRNNLSQLAYANAGLLDQQGAIRAAERIRDLGWDASRNAHDAALVLAECIPIVTNADELDEGKRQAAVQFYGEQAMVMLRTAVEKGWKDAEHLKRDRRFNPLRSRDDFKKLLEELDAKVRSEDSNRAN